MADEEPEVSEEDVWFERKSEIMEDILGKEHDMVGHSVVPYALGGGLDLFYYPNGIAGTAIATKELCEVLDECPSNNLFQCYELVMFTHHPIDLDVSQDESTPFGRIHESINAILHCMAPYSEQATLNPGETCEFPAEIETVGGKCLVFDDYGTTSNDEQFGLLALIEIYRSEMNYAREHGGKALINVLKEHGVYPYSDLEREPLF